MKRYLYICLSKSGGRIWGTYSSEQTDRDYVTDAVLFRVSQVAVEANIPWDPFNLELLVKAQNEPKQS